MIKFFGESAASQIAVTLVIFHSITVGSYQIGIRACDTWAMVAIRVEEWEKKLDSEVERLQTNMGARFNLVQQQFIALESTMNKLAESTMNKLVEMFQMDLPTLMSNLMVKVRDDGEGAGQADIPLLGRRPCA